MANPGANQAPWLITGAKGQMGGALQEVFASRGLDFIALDRSGLDITDEAACQKVITGLRPGVILNCAAYTKVDQAEDEPELARAVNAQGPANLARAAARTNSLLVHFSTDFVFDGQSQRPYREDDPPGPICVYGQTKWAGEEAVRSIWRRHLILRTAWLFGPHGPNFVRTMIRLAGEKDRLNVVDDQVGSPSFSLDLAASLPLMIQKGLLGTYHLVNAGQVSWFGLAEKIMELIGAATEVQPIKASEFNAKATRPALSALDTQALAGQGIDLRPWQEALADFLAREGRLAVTE